jgi:hypothetical protein
MTRPSSEVASIGESTICTLEVASNRESNAPGVARFRQVEHRPD